MAPEPSIAEQEIVWPPQHPLERQRLANIHLADYWAVTKPEVNFLIVITTFAGFWLARPNPSHHFQFFLLAHTLLGTMLAARGAGTLNQYIERRFDEQMTRTARRLVASGRLNPATALRFGISLSFTGCTYLALAVNALASSIAFLTLTSYLFIYTPLKRRTPLCTLVGVFPGAAQSEKPVWTPEQLKLIVDSVARLVMLANRRPRNEIVVYRQREDAFEQPHKIANRLRRRSGIQSRLYKFLDVQRSNVRNSHGTKRGQNVNVEFAVIRPFRGRVVMYTPQGAVLDHVGIVLLSSAASDCLPQCNPSKDETLSIRTG